MTSKSRCHRLWLAVGLLLHPSPPSGAHLECHPLDFPVEGKKEHDSIGFRCRFISLTSPAIQSSYLIKFEKRNFLSNL